MFKQNFIKTPATQLSLIFLKRNQTSQAQLTVNYDKAKDYKSIPRLSTFKFLRDFMPGGKFQDASFFDYALEMRKCYGDIYILPGLFGRPDMVMIFNTKDFETVYRNEGTWPSRHGFDSVKYFREKIKGDFFKGTTGLVVSQGEYWGKMRSTVNPVLLKPQNLLMFLKPMQEIGKEFVERIKLIRDPKSFEVSPTFDSELTRLAFESVSLVALNRKLGLINQTSINPEAERLIVCAKKNFSNIYKLDIQPSIWKIIPTPLFYKSLKYQEDLFTITHNYVEESLQQIKNKSKKGEHNEDIYSPLEKVLLSDKKLAVALAMDMLIAGVDALSVTFMAILLCLAKNPEKQEKLREEILKIMPLKNTALNETNTKNMPYLRAVIKESMRYYPNGVGASRNPIQDIVLSGYKIPKGSNIILNYNSLLKDETLFPKALKFIPERWLRDDQSLKGKKDPFSFLPFGVGPRSCVGKRLVDLELELVILMLLRNFKVEFHYDATKPFRADFLNMPNIPMCFTFKDIDY